jgi:hypothetical protein
MLRRARDLRVGLRSTVHEKDVEPAIAVEVEEQTARAHDLNEVLVRAGAVDVSEDKASLPAGVAEGDRLIDFGALGGGCRNQGQDYDHTRPH